MNLYKVFLRHIYLTACLFIPASLLAQATENNPKISPTLLAKFTSSHESDFVVLMNEQPNVGDAKYLHGKAAKANYVYSTLVSLSSKSQSDLVAYLNSQHVFYQPFWVVNAVMVHGNYDLAEKLAARTDVSRILNNTSMAYAKPVHTSEANTRDIVIPWGVDSIHAPEVWQMGFKGQGVVIGGQDTGYDWEHPAIKNQYRGWTGTSVDNNYNWHDAIHTIDPHNYNYGENPCGINIKSPCDDYGHGTHTMGTMVGEDSDLKIGIAPEAKWIGERNMERGWGNLSSYMEAFQWFIAPTDTNNENADPGKAPDVINDSWVCIQEEGCDTSNFGVLEEVVQNVKASGIVVVASAGNDGPFCNTIFYPPAMYAESFSVGAIDSTFNIASFSSRGNVTIDSSGIMKPNVAAPGVDVLSSIPGDQYAYYSGTSMAGPHTVGTVALMISANPLLAGEVDEIESIIEQTALPKTTGDGCGGDNSTSVPNNTYGYGIINALAAVQMASTVTASDILAQEKKIKVFPTVTQGVLFIELSEFSDGSVLQLFNLEGKFIRSYAVSSANTAIDLSSLSSDIYLYKIITNGELFSGKVVKQ